MQGIISISFKECLTSMPFGCFAACHRVCSSSYLCSGNSTVLKGANFVALHLAPYNPGVAHICAHLRCHRLRYGVFLALPCKCYLWIIRYIVYHLFQCIVYQLFQSKVYHLCKDWIRYFSPKFTSCGYRDCDNTAQSLPL